MGRRVFAYLADGTSGSRVPGVCACLSWVVDARANAPGERFAGLVAAWGGGRRGASLGEADGCGVSVRRHGPSDEPGEAYIGDVNDAHVFCFCRILCKRACSSIASQRAHHRNGTVWELARIEPGDMDPGEAGGMAT